MGVVSIDPRGGTDAAVVADAGFAWDRREVSLDGGRRAVLIAVSGLAAWAAAATDAGLLGGPEATVAGLVAVGLVITTTARLVGLSIMGRHPTLGALSLRRMLRVIALSAALEFGLLLCLGIAWTPVAPDAAVLFSVAALACGTAAVTLSMDRVLRLGIPAACLVPPLLLTAWTSLDRHLPLIVLGLALAPLLFAATRRTHDEYWRFTADVADRTSRNRELEQLSQTDALTGIANRLSFDLQLGRRWQRAERRGGFVSLLLIDLDHFKRLNDTHGHSFGDRCLVAVAAVIADQARDESDLAARYGGEEFAVLLNGASRSAALIVAERIREHVAAIAVSDAMTEVRLTCSIGVATVAPVQSVSGPHDLVDAADAALYAAKDGGRDCVRQAD